METLELLKFLKPTQLFGIVGLRVSGNRLEHQILNKLKIKPFS